MTASDQQRLKYLAQFGFNAEQQAEWQSKVIDGTFAAFSETPPEIRSGDDSALAGFYFTLSAQERKRHRVLRRMPYVVARQLALKKNKRDPTAPRRLLILEDAPEELFRVVVSFL